MKDINIFITGKYEYKFGIGTWTYYLNYKQAVIKRTGQLANAVSPGRTLLYALYMALQQVNEPCHIIIHTKSPLGFKNPKKSTNKDLIIKIQTLINKMGHTVNINVTNDFNKVTMWEQVYGTPIHSDKRKAVPDIKNKNTPNSVFDSSVKEDNYDKIVEEQAMKSKDWREMYSDLMGPSQGTWVPGSGGY